MAEEQMKSTLLLFNDLALIYKRLGNNDKLATCFNNLGVIYYFNKNYDSSIMFLNASIEKAYEVIEY
jgi:hypothetical protein